MAAPNANRRTIVVVGPLPPPVHGASRVTRSVLDALTGPAADAHVEVRVADTSGSRPGRERPGPGYHVRRAGAHLAACGTIAAARRRGPVSVYIGGAGGLGLWYQLAVVVTARLLGARVYFHHHSYSYLAGPRSLVMRWMSGWMGTRDAHVFLSDGMADTFAALYGTRSVPLVVSNAAFVDARPRPARGPSATFRLIHVSNLSVEKGSVRVMEAFERLRDAAVEVSLTLVGATSDPDVDRTVARLRDRHPETFRSLGHGTQQDVASALDESDLFLFPSTYRIEAQPLVVLEALARGVPVLANDRGTLRDLLPDDWLLTEPDDDLERRIREMIRADWSSLSARAVAAFEGSRTTAADLAGPLLSRWPVTAGSSGAVTRSRPPTSPPTGTSDDPSGREREVNVRILALLLGLLPASGLKNRLLSFLPGWTVARNARVHPCVFWNVYRVQIGPGANVGVANYFRAMRSVVVGERAEIGQLNWLSGAAAFVDVQMPEQAATVTLGTMSGITSRHYVDCSGGLVISDRAVLGGVRSTVLTHSADIRTAESRAVPVVLGEQTIVFSGVIITPGVTVAPRCVLAAGAVVSASLTEPETMYGGVPARAVGSMKDAAFFERDDRLYPRDSMT